MTYRLNTAAKNTVEKEVWIVPGGAHNNTFAIAGPMYFIRLRQFFDKCLSIANKRGRTINRIDTPMPKSDSLSPSRKKKSPKKEKKVKPA